MQQIVLYKSGTQTTSVSRLINVSQLQYLRTNLTDLKQAKRYNDRTFSITTEKARSWKERRSMQGKKTIKLKETQAENSKKTFFC